MNDAKTGNPIKPNVLDRSSKWPNGEVAGFAIRLNKQNINSKQNAAGLNLSTSN